MNKYDLLLALCQNKSQEVKVVLRVNGKIVETDIENVIFDLETKAFKLITKE